MNGVVSDQRFEVVGALARKLAEAGGGGALCVYLNGVPVLDVWAGERDPTCSRPWEHDTMAMSWSTTKGVTSTALHMLADRVLTVSALFPFALKDQNESGLHGVPLVRPVQEFERAQEPPGTCQ
jgi:hypothetical protein